MSSNKEYDLICSLGGNCAAAHNLRIRNLRTVAYPFDWTYFKSDRAIYKLADNFVDGFKNFLKKENLELLPVNEAHSDKFQYLDKYSDIIWANHFCSSIENEHTYLAVKTKIDRRFKRLIDNIAKSSSILFVISVYYETQLDAFKYLHNILKTLYPNKKFDIKVISFNCLNDELLTENNIELYKYKRATNNYDFTKTNYEWAFLDKVEMAKTSSVRGRTLSMLPRKLCSISCGKYRLKLVLEMRI